MLKHFIEFVFPSFVPFLSHEKIPSQFARFFGQLLLGNMLAVVVSLGIPNAEEMPWGIDLSWVGVALRPGATAVGIWLVGNIGRQKVITDY